MTPQAIVERRYPGRAGGALIAVLTVVLTATPASPAAADSGRQQAPCVDAGIDEVAWIAGEWRLERDGEVLEEVWAEPLGNSMSGMFRWLRDGKVWMYEHLIIERRAEGLFFHLRHFAPGSIAWEAKDQPYSYRLVRMSDGEAVFENGESTQPLRFVFRQPEPDALHVVLVHADEEGRETETVFAYRRVAR